LVLLKFILRELAVVFRRLVRDPNSAPYQRLKRGQRTHVEFPGCLGVRGCGASTRVSFSRNLPARELGHLAARRRHPRGPKRVPNLLIAAPNTCVVVNFGGHRLASFAKLNWQEIRDNRFWGCCQRGRRGCRDADSHHLFLFGLAFPWGADGPITKSWELVKLHSQD